jgi:tetratricopeptide (TPR) repeat protein
VQVYERARELCQQLEDMPQLFPLQWYLAQLYGMRSDFQTALEMKEQLLNLAEQAEDPERIAMAHLTLGWDRFVFGEFALALTHFKPVIDWYDPDTHHSLFVLYGQEPGVGSLEGVAWALWSLGYPEQGLQRIREALALAQEQDQLHILLGTLLGAAGLHQVCGEVETAQEWIEAACKLATEHGLAFFQAQAAETRGWALVEQGQVDEGMALMRQSIADFQAMGITGRQAYSLATLATAYWKMGQTEEGLTLLAEALVLVEESEGRWCEAQIHRVKGELLSTQGDAAEAEASFCKAIEVARRQQAKSLELQAVTGLCRLWGKQGKREEARRMLEEIYGWFTEGFDTRDLREARALLEELAGEEYGSAPSG